MRVAPSVRRSALGELRAELLHPAPGLLNLALQPPDLSCFVALFLRQSQHIDDEDRDRREHVRGRRATHEVEIKAAGGNSGRVVFLGDGDYFATIVKRATGRV